LPWIIRNGTVVGIPTVSTISQYNLLYYNAASLEAGRNDRLESDVRNELSDRVNQILADRGLPETEANLARAEGELAREIILADPVRYAWVHLKSDLNNFLPDTDLLEIWGLTMDQRGTLDVLKQQGLLAAVRHYFGGSPWMIGLLVPVIFILGLVYLGWAAGSIRVVLTRQVYPFLFLNLPIAYFMLLPGSPSNPRFRVPVMPYFCLMAAFGLLFLWRQIKLKGKRP
jgi:hypothetical protein